MLHGRQRDVLHFVRIALNDDDNTNETYSHQSTSTFRLENWNVCMTWKIIVAVSGTIVCITWDEVNVEGDVITSLRASAYTINKADVCVLIWQISSDIFSVENSLDNVTFNISFHFFVVLCLLLLPLTQCAMCIQFNFRAIHKAMTC